MWINQNTEIDDALETNVDFPFKELHPTSVNPQQATVKDLDVIKVFESVTVRGLVLVGDNQPEIVPSKQNLKKLEACFVDESGTIPITIWNEHIEKVEDKRYYQIENVRLRQYLGQKYLSVSLQTTFTEISSSHFPNLSSEAVHEATRQFLGTAINCQSIQSVEIIAYYSCISCKKRVKFRIDTVILKCDNCSASFLISKSNKSLTARIAVKIDENISWYSMFTSVLERFVAKYNEKFQKNETIDGIDEDKLSEIILMSEGMTLHVNNSTKSVTSITFV